MNTLRIRIHKDDPNMIEIFTDSNVKGRIWVLSCFQADFLPELGIDQDWLEENGEAVLRAM